MTRAVSLDPEYIPAAAGLIISRVERGDLRKAHQDAERLVRRRPDTVDAHFSLSYVLRFAGLLKESATLRNWASAGCSDSNLRIEILCDRPHSAR
jgi:hypothetical protein